MKTNFAKVKWSEELGRYELHIDGVLKAYSQGDNDNEHEVGKDQLKATAEKKGYTVSVVNKK